MAGIRPPGPIRYEVRDCGYNTECWVIQMATNNKGYGRLRRHGREWLAHRWIYIQHVGPIPAGLLVCHHCDNPPCINPDHLFLGAHADNAADMVTKGRARGGGPESLVLWRSTRPQEILRGERHPAARLTPDQVLAIRERYRMGDITQLQLAVQFGVSRGHVADICRGRAWAHV
jgi:hypothetical protein